MSDSDQTSTLDAGTIDAGTLDAGTPGVDAPVAPSYAAPGVPAYAATSQAPVYAPRPRFMDQVLGMRGVIAVALACVVLGGVGGAVLGATTNGGDGGFGGRTGPGGFQPGQQGQFQQGRQGQLPQGQVPRQGTAPNGG